MPLWRHGNAERTESQNIYRSCCLIFNLTIYSHVQNFFKTAFTHSGSLMLFDDKLARSLLSHDEDVAFTTMLIKQAGMPLPHNRHENKLFCPNHSVKIALPQSFYGTMLRGQDLVAILLPALSRNFGCFTVNLPGSRFYAMRTTRLRRCNFSPSHPVPKTATRCAQTIHPPCENCVRLTH